LRGRYWFRRFRIVFRVMQLIMSLLPRFVAAGLWWLAKGWGGPLGLGLRYIAAKRLAAALGETVFFGPDLEVRNWQSLRIGHFVSIHRWTYIDAVGGITIGNDVSIAHASSILSFEHTWSDQSRPIRDNPIHCAPVNIGNDVWLGCGVRILAGVNIGQRSVIAAGAVVVTDVLDGTIAGGVPAKFIGSTSG
jgi:acetyltransferase-like isoleucine patch superfamily enzyme